MQKRILTMNETYYQKFTNRNLSVQIRLIFAYIHIQLMLQCFQLHYLYDYIIFHHIDSG